VPARPEVPELRPLVAVAEALGPLRDRVVFIGGAIAPLLQTAPAGGRIRPTDDVDGLVALAASAEAGRLDAELRALGFRRPMSEWDRIAVETAVSSDLSPGLRVRHASAPAFLALKWAAFLDRGAADPSESHDLEDILALLASRPGIEEEVARAPVELRRFIAERAERFLAQPAHRDLLASCLGHAPGAGAVIAGVEANLEALRALR
jgi:hypothetical protein